MQGRTRLVAAGLATAAMTAGLVPAQARAAEDRPAIEWTACAGEGFPAGTRCGTLDVPLDWAHPDGRTTTLRIARLPATDPARRIGSVLHIPGGPGSSGIEDVKRAAGDLAGLRERFDLVAYDPRNTGLAAKLPESCAQPAVPALTEPRSRAEYDAQAGAVAAAVRRCRAEDRSGLYGRLDSVSVARDMEAIRAALGERRLGFMANPRGISPNLGGATFDQLACSGWPLPVANPSRPLPVRGLPPLLGVGTWGDFAWTDSLVRRVPGSATVRYDGPGHVLYLSGNRCAIGHATRYLTDLTLPPPGTVCLPGD